MIDEETKMLAGELYLGADVWLGGGAIVCPGVTIGAGTTIGAGSVVTRDIPLGVVAAGNPCRILRALDPAAADDPSPGIIFGQPDHGIRARASSNPGEMG